MPRRRKTPQQPAADQGRAAADQPGAAPMSRYQKRKAGLLVKRNRRKPRD